MSENIKKGFSALTISSFFFILSGYLVNIWVGRSLGPDMYGLYGVTIALWSGINLLLVSGLPQAVTRYTASSANEADSILLSALKLQIILIIILTALTYFFADYIAYLLNDKRLSSYISLSAFIIPFFSLYSLYGSYFNGLKQFSKQSKLSIIYSLCKVFLVIILTRYYLLVGTILGFIFAPLAALIFGFYLPKSTNKKYSYKKLILYSVPIAGFTVLFTLQQSVDLFIVKALSANTVLPGFYTAAQNIARIPLFILSALTLVIFPNISESVSQNLNDKTSKLILYGMRLALIILVPLCLVISLYSTQILKLIYSNTYLQASGPLSYLVIGISFLTIFSLLANILNGADKPYLSLLISAFGLFLTIILCYIFIPVFGLNGAAIAATSGNLLTMLLASIFVLKKFKVLIKPSSFFKIIFSGLIMFLIGKYLLYSVILFPVSVIILPSVYLFLLYLVKEITKEDWRHLLDMVPNRLLTKGKLNEPPNL